MIRKFLGLCGLLFFATACSDISDDDRLIEMETVRPVRSIVIEDFTGQNCVNCPDAHAVLEALVEQYGSEYVIPVSIHAGSFAMSASLTNYDRGLVCLMQPEGNQLQDLYGQVNSWPIGVVNGRGGFSNPDAWAQATRIELLRPAEADIKIDAEFMATQNIEIVTEIEPFEDIDVTLKLWVIESGIIARQRNTTETLLDYCHNNVWRATVTPLEGEPVALTDGKTITLRHSIELRNTEKERWIPSNLSIVGILCTPSGYVNAALAKVSIATN